MVVNSDVRRNFPVGLKKRESFTEFKGKIFKDFLESQKSFSLNLKVNFKAFQKWSSLDLKMIFPQIPLHLQKRSSLTSELELSTDFRRSHRHFTSQF